MHEDPLGMKPALSLIGLFLMLAVIGLILFRQEVGESLRAGINPNLRNTSIWLAPGEVNSLAAFSLEPEHNDAKFISVSNLSIGSNSPKGIPVSFKLTNHGDSNDYPNIRLAVRKIGDRAARIVTFKPSDYPHAGRFDSLDIKLTVPVFSDENGFTVQPFYESRE